MVITCVDQYLKISYLDVIVRMFDDLISSHSPSSMDS